MSAVNEENEYGSMSLTDLHMEKDDVAFLMVEAEGEELEALESKLEEIENIISLKENDNEELDF